MGKNAPRKMSAVAEKQDGDRYPGYGTDRTKYLNDWIDDLVRCRIPAEAEAERNAQKRGQAECDGNAPEGVRNIVPEDVFLQQLGKTFPYLERGRKNLGAGPDHGNVPRGEQQREGDNRPEEFFPLSRRLKWLHIL
jgi:hypothetical protein